MSLATIVTIKICTLRGIEEVQEVTLDDGSQYKTRCNTLDLETAVTNASLALHEELDEQEAARQATSLRRKNYALSRAAEWKYKRLLAQGVICKEPIGGGVFLLSYGAHGEE